MKLILLPISIVILIFAGGCANWTHAYRDFDVDDGSGAVIDIKQRAIIASKRYNEDTGRIMTMVCAEPSPDALSALSAQLAAEADVPSQVSARLAGAFQEQAAFVGLRTQTIQLLRDEMYRLCESFLNGSLNQNQYDMLLRRYQKYMVALMAIEQLTGVVRVPVVAINTQGSAEVGKTIARKQKQIQDIDAKIANFEAAKKKDGITDAEKAELDKQINAEKAKKSKLEKEIESAAGALVTGSGSTQIEVQGTTITISTGVAEVVKEIVLKILMTDDLGQICFSYLSNDANRFGELSQPCKDYINSTVEYNQVIVELLKNAVNNPSLLQILIENNLVSAEGKPGTFMLMGK